MVFPHDTPSQAEMQGIGRESDFSRTRAQFENEEIMDGFQELLQKYLSEFCNVEKKMEQIPPSSPNLKTLTLHTIASHPPSPLICTMSWLPRLYCTIAEMCKSWQHVFTWEVCHPLEDQQGRLPGSVIPTIPQDILQLWPIFYFLLHTAVNLLFLLLWYDLYIGSK